MGEERGIVREKGGLPDTRENPVQTAQTCSLTENIRDYLLSTILPSRTQQPLQINTHVDISGNSLSIVADHSTFDFTTPTRPTRPIQPRTLSRPPCVQSDMIHSYVI